MPFSPLSLFAVSREDVDIYAAVPMKDCAKIECRVLNVYGILGQQTNQASYDVGKELLTDGVVPFSDVEHPANLCRNHTLKFVHGVGKCRASVAALPVPLPFNWANYFVL